MGTKKNPLFKTHPARHGFDQRCSFLDLSNVGFDVLQYAMGCHFSNVPTWTPLPRLTPTNPLECVWCWWPAVGSFLVLLQCVPRLDLLVLYMDLLQSTISTRLSYTQVIARHPAALLSLGKRETLSFLVFHFSLFLFFFPFPRTHSLITSPRPSSLFAPFSLLPPSLRS